MVTIKCEQCDKSTEKEALNSDGDSQRRLWRRDGIGVIGFQHRELGKHKPSRWNNRDRSMEAGKCSMLGSCEESRDRRTEAGVGGSQGRLR